MNFLFTVLHLLGDLSLDAEPTRVDQNFCCTSSTVHSSLSKAQKSKVLGLTEIQADVVQLYLIITFALESLA